eukprot:scaffold156825_cov30-Tisochrysis_lutea.AAC.5
MRGGQHPRLRATGALGKAREPHLLASHFHECYGLRLAGFEPYARASRHVEPHAQRCRAIKHKCRVGFNEVIMRTDLRGCKKDPCV